jgi:hypothetical protein
MSARDSSRLGTSGTLIIFAGLMTVGVLAGMVYLPPYFADREVSRAARNAADQAQPIESDEQMLGRINGFLMSSKTSRYWVEADGQHTSLDLQLKPDNLTVTRDGNRSFAFDIGYTQEMFVPLLKQTKVFTYRDHADSPQR